MDSDFQIQPKQHYLRVVSKGRLTSGTLCNGWKRVVEESRSHGLNRILCESHTLSKASTSDIYNCGKNLADLMFPANARIAFLCSQENLEDMQLMELVLHNRRCLKTGVFIDREEAVSWLQNNL